MTATQTSSRKLMEFVAFCIEMYAEEHNTSGSAVAAAFETFGVIGYLCENYEALHGQGKRWLLQDISNYLKNRGFEE